MPPTLGVAAGAAVAPVANQLLGIRGALVAIGVLGPLAVLATWPALGRLDLRIRAREADARGSGACRPAGSRTRSQSTEPEPPHPRPPAAGRSGAG